MTQHQTERKEALEWWTKQTPEIKKDLFDNYKADPKNFTPATFWGQLTGREVQIIKELVTSRLTHP